MLPIDKVPGGNKEVEVREGKGEHSSLSGCSQGPPEDSGSPFCMC